MTDLTWTNERRKLGDLSDWEPNPRSVSKTQGARLVRSFETFGQVQTIAIEPDNTLIDGHQRAHVLAASEHFGPDHEVDVRVLSRKLTDKERQAIVVALHAGAVGSWDWDKVPAFDFGIAQDWGFDAETLTGWNDDAANLREWMAAEEEAPEFKEYDESIADDVEMIECPECGHRFPK